MNLIVKTATTIVAAGLLGLTVKGAHALTGSLAMTAVLGALVVVQWAAARRALLALSAPGGRPRWRRAIGPAAIWFAAANVTVSFVGAELYEMFTAQHQAEHRFEVEQSRLRARARELADVLRSVESATRQYQVHATAMADREEHLGGSCTAGSRPGPGDIRAFRRQDAMAASQLGQQVEPQLASADEVIKGIERLQFSGAVADMRRTMSRAADDLNALQRASLWAQAAAFADAQQAAAGSIPGGPDGTQRCEDNARGLLLKQMARAAQGAQALVPLAPPQLLDHNDSRHIAQATMVRTFSWSLGLLPRALWGDTPLVDESLRTQYGLGEKEALLGPNRLPLLLAWVLEFVLIALMLLSHGDGSSSQPGVIPRLSHWAMSRLQRRAGLVGELATALSGPADPGARPLRLPYFEAGRLFADDAMEQRAWMVAPWYRPWGARDIVAVPICRYGALRAARELRRAGHLAYLAYSVSTAGLLKDRRLAGVMHALSSEGEGGLPETVWDVYEVASDEFARWLLSQPVEARAVLAARA